jgi:hypothetical protein
MPDEPKVDPHKTPAPTPLEAELKLKPEEIFKKYGIKETPDTVIDVFEPDDAEGRAIEADLVKHFGGPEGDAIATRDLQEAVSIFAPEGEFEKAVEKMTRTEEAQAIKDAVAEWRGVLSDKAKAQVTLQALYDNPDKEPGRSYFRGNASPAVNEAFAKLWQAAHGEPITGIQRPRGDGFIR